ncbi:hypothetical protein [Cohnella soli]|uniref:SH3 domain-containing protein n=1 Tax=Cohnella soli TaxID=425005 RepID=A0ABW0HXG9_9BACL
MNRKTWLFAISLMSFFLVFGAIPADATNSYPSTITLKHSTNTYEAPDDKDPSNVKLSPQELHIYGMRPSDGHSAFNWYRITTWRGEKWVKLTEADFIGQEELIVSDVALLEKTQLYDAPKSVSATGKWLGKMTVHAEAISGSFLKIGTDKGPKWIRISPDMLLDVQTQPIDLKLDAAVTPAYARPDGTLKTVTELGPQVVHAFEQKDHWYHVRINGTNVWVNPDIAIPVDVTKQAMTADVQQKTMMFAYPSFDSKPLGVIASQKVKVVATVGGWKRIESD